MAGQMSEKQVARLRELFDSIDADGKGKITLDEFSASMEGCQIDQANIEEMFNSADGDGDGDIEFDEFCQIMQKDRENVQADLREAFKACDQDGNGFLSVDEITQMLNENACGRISEDQLAGIIDEIDKNDDNKVSIEEFMTVFNDF